MKKTAVVMVSIFLAAGVWAMGSKEGIKSDTSATTVSAAVEVSVTPVINTNAAKTVNQSQGSGSQQTIKTEQQAPGVMVEHREDGTKVVTINLSEVDENKLPEKYEAEVILEAPVYQLISGNRELYFNDELLGKFERDSTFKLNRSNITKSGTFLKGGVDNYPEGIDVKIDGSGNIFILDMYNGRIQKFNSEGKHIRNIPLKDNFEFGGTEGGRAVRLKDEISVWGDRVFVRDTVKNCIEALDESGKVLETIEVPEEIDGKKTREMKMWADEEGVGVGQPSMNLRLTKDRKLNGEKGERKKQKNEWISQIRENKYFKKEWKALNDIYLKIQSKIAMVGISDYFIDEKLNSFIYVYSDKQDDSRIIKITNTGDVLASIPYWPYWKDERWRDKCQKVPKPLLNPFSESQKYDSNGNIYLVQIVCCSEEDCIGKMRIVKLFFNKGK